MNFQEAVELLKQGVYLKRQSNPDRFYNINVCSKDKLDNYCFSYNDVIANDWETCGIKKEKTKDLTFGEALEFIKKNDVLSRKCWNNPDICIFLSLDHDEEEERYIKVKTIRNHIVPWIPNHQELLASDWYVVKDE